MDGPYAVPDLVELGTFAEETGTWGARNWDEFVWPFDEWR